VSSGKFSPSASHPRLTLSSQEVDRTEKLLPVLENAGFSHRHASGINKRHGCLIAWADKQYSQLDHALINYDEQGVGLDADDQPRRGNSFMTRNIALLVALERRDDTSRGLVVATTHLFWHPRQVILCSHDSFRDSIDMSFRYTYERARSVSVCLFSTGFTYTSSGKPAYSCAR
jgi:mRNA deadenylase 3'-5' endonuclease subunit Ccr4